MRTVIASPISRGMGRRARERITAYTFVIPTVLIFLFIIAIPTVSGICYSFTNWSGISSEIKFIGIDNYKRLFEDKVFLIAIKNTLILTAVVVILQNFFGLMLAMALNSKKIKGRDALRAIFFIPSLLSIIVVGYTWLYILNVHVGILGMVLKSLGIEQIVKYDVFLKPLPAILTVAFTMIWQFSGYNMVIYLAGLQSIPQELYEASNIDGANKVQKFMNVTLPLIVPSITVNSFLNVIGCLKIFEHVYIMTKGGPGNTTETVGTFIYNSAFSSSQMGYGTAISTVLFLGILVVTIIQVKFLRSKEVEL